MSIGLTADELMQVFSESFEQRLDLFIGKLAGVQTGENPKIKEIIEKSIEKIAGAFPNITNPQFFVGISLIFGTAFYALMDAIEANNLQIEKSFHQTEN